MSAGPEALSPDVLDQVREQLARSGARLSPEVVAGALRERGRPVGDATVLAVHDLLRQDVLGAGPLEPLLRLPGVTDVLVNGAQAVYVDRGDGLELTDHPLPRRGRGAQAGAASGRLRGAPSGRLHSVRRPAPARRVAVPCGPGSPGPTGDGRVATGPARPGVHPR